MDKLDLKHNAMLSVNLESDGYSMDGGFRDLEIALEVESESAPMFCCTPFQCPKFSGAMGSPSRQQATPFHLPSARNHRSELFAAHPSNIPKALVHWNCPGSGKVS